MRPDDAAAALLRRRRFLRHHDQVAATRRFVSQALPRGSELRETARLLVSETVTSILDQAPAGPGHGSFEVAWAVIEHRLRVAVSDDGGPARLRHRIHDRESASGSGLQLGQTLADRWGVREGLAGRTIWFELDLPNDSSQALLFLGMGYVFGHFERSCGGQDLRDRGPYRHGVKGSTS